MKDWWRRRNVRLSLTLWYSGATVVVLALYALAAGRSTVNPIHGAAYEEAQVRAAAAHGPGQVT